MKTMEDILLQRSSVREYDASKTIPKEHLDTIIKAIQQSPTYISGQQYSVIVIDEQEKKAQMVEWTKGKSGKTQEYIKDASVFLLFLMDFNKVAQISAYENMPLEITEYMEALLIGTIDVGIGVEAATVCAESLGYGTVVIGAVRKAIDAIIEGYSLPKYTFPLLGLCIGYPKEHLPPRPRLSMQTFAHHNCYELHNFEKAIEEENALVKEYYKKEKNIDMSWSTMVANFYKQGYLEELSELYKKQGFNLK